MAAVARTFAAATELAELDRILGERRLRSVYQPIVHLDTGEVAGYEALARGPEGSPLERPDRLFAAAAAAGRTAELEWACREAALAGALAGGLDAPRALFLNVEPSMLAEPVPPASRRSWRRRGSACRSSSSSPSAA